MSISPATVNYFCYGSNLLTDRIRVRLKGSQKICQAILPDYQLIFSGYSNLWKGATANIVPSKGSHVIGIVWSITYIDLENLIVQEKGYRLIAIKVNCCEKENGKVVDCITFVQTDEEVAKGREILKEDDGKPSYVYKEVIIKGAIEHKLPENYVESIRSFQDNSVQNCELSHLVK